MSCYRVLRLAKHQWCHGEDRQEHWATSYVVVASTSWILAIVASRCRMLGVATASRPLLYNSSTIGSRIVDAANAVGAST
jgi:hypothetical protein